LAEYIYDRVPYVTQSYPNAHPRNLAAIATLYGLNPTAVDHCRVLVLGCAHGGNLFPVATLYPDSQFIGIDNSERQIETAQSTADTLGLSNTELHCMDILDIDERMGQFDYVIAHGIYSWVPSHVRDKVFQICKTRLTPNGIAYLSYNALPGGHFNGIVRDIMLYRFNDYEDPEEGVNQAIAYLEKITGIIPTQGNAYMFLLKLIQQTQVSSKDHAYVLHDYLERDNDAFYFHEIVKKGQALGLQYLGDATFIGREFASQSPETSREIMPITRDLIDFEQHIDFLINRVFRCSLFCHEGLSIRPKIPENNPARPLYFSSMAQIVTPPNGQQSTGISSFKNSFGSVMTDQNPLFQGAMKHLIAIYPEAVTFNQLLDTLLPAFKLQQSENNQALEQDIALLYEILLQARSSSLINITIDKPPVVTVSHAYSSEHKLVAAPFARVQAQSGNIVVSAWNENVGLTEFDCHLLRLLDGTRKIRELKKEMLSRHENGSLKIPIENTASIQSHEYVKIIKKMVDSRLEFFAKSGLLLTK